MKKLLTLLLVAAMLLSLAACSADKSPENPPAMENNKSNRGQGLATSFTISGITFSIPSYYEKDGDFFNYSENGKLLARLNFAEEDLSESQEEFDKHKDKITENMIGSFEATNMSAQLLDSNDTTLAGLSARRFSLAVMNNSNEEVTVYTTFTYNYNERKLLGVTYYDFGQEPDFLNDYYQIIETAVLTALSSHVTYTPFTIAGVAFSIPSYYEQEDTDFNYYKNGKLYAILKFMEKDCLTTQEEFNENKDELMGELISDQDIAELLDEEDIILAGLSTRYISFHDSDNNTFCMTLTYNLVEGKILFVIHVSQESDLLNDYKQMIETATLTASGESVSQVTPPESNDTSALASGIRPEFKESMDSYEAFFDEYIAFMEKYTSSNDPLGMLANYTEYLSKYTEAMTTFDKINDGTLSSEELVYYLEVQNRIMQKLLTIAQ